MLVFAHFRKKMRFQAGCLENQCKFSTKRSSLIMKCMKICHWMLNYNQSINKLLIRSLSVLFFCLYRVEYKRPYMLSKISFLKITEIS